MTYPSVNYAVAKNCMDMIAAGAVNDAFESLGITQEDLRLCIGPEPWIATDRGRVTTVLNMLTHGSLDVIGLPRIEVPAEYRAAVIATFVSPGNMAIACRWCETGATAEALSSGGMLEPVSAQRLFGLVCQLYAEAPQARFAWAKAVGRAVREVIGNPTPVAVQEQEADATS